MIGTIRREYNFGIGSEADRVEVICSKCRGARIFKRFKLSYTPVKYSALNATEFSVDDCCDVEVVDCPKCGGEGFVTPKDGDRVNVVRSGVVIGTCLVPATVRAMPWVDRRPGDYIPRAVEGRMVYEAASTLGLGDIECLNGFISATGEVGGYEEQLDTLRKVFKMKSATIIGAKNGTGKKEKQAR